MALNIRSLLSLSMNVPIGEDLLSGQVAELYWSRSLEFYQNYRVWPRESAFITGYSSTFVLPANAKSVSAIRDLVTGSLIKGWQINGNVISSLPGGSYVVEYTQNNIEVVTDVEDPPVTSPEIKSVPVDLINLYCGYCKIPIGQRLKFASFGQQPFNVDNALFGEGNSEVEKAKQFIIVNRDERFSNLLS